MGNILQPEGSADCVQKYVFNEIGFRRVLPDLDSLNVDGHSCCG
jgi:hypothetical protein